MEHDNPNTVTTGRTVRPLSILRRSRRISLKVFLVGAVLIVLVVGGVYFYFAVHRGGQAEKPMTDAQFASYSQALQYAQLASAMNDPIARATQLSGAGDLMDQAGKTKKSLDYYLQAQKIVDSNNLHKKISIDFSQEIAQEYAKLGDKRRARHYYDAAIAAENLNKDTPAYKSVMSQLQSAKAKL